MKVFRCLCQDCMAVNLFKTQEEQLAAHQEFSRAECHDCGSQYMCCCLGCEQTIQNMPEGLRFGDAVYPELKRRMSATSTWQPEVQP